jgi:AcrR family transcriptional regulator
MTAEVLTDRRSRILRAAERHFAEQPYDTVSTVAIAADAECNRGWIYHEFGSKRDLYLAVLQRTAKVPSLPPLTGLVAGTENLEETAGKLIDRWLDGVSATRESFLALQRVHTGSHSDPVVRGVLREINEGTIDNVLATVIEDPAQAPPAVRAVVACFGELAWQALWEWLESERLDREQVHALLTGSLIALLELMPKVLA